MSDVGVSKTYLKFSKAVVMALTAAVWSSEFAMHWTIISLETKMKARGEAWATGVAEGTMTLEAIMLTGDGRNGRSIEVLLKVVRLDCS